MFLRDFQLQSLFNFNDIILLHICSASWDFTFLFWINNKNHKHKYKKRALVRWWWIKGHQCCKQCIQAYQVKIKISLTQISWASPLWKQISYALLLLTGSMQSSTVRKSSRHKIITLLLKQILCLQICMWLLQECLCNLTYFSPRL